MTWAPQQTQISLFNTLKGDSALMVLLGSTVGGAQKVFDFVPENQAFPFITIEAKPFKDRGNHTYEGVSGEVWVHVWHQPGGAATGLGDKQVQIIQARVDALLHAKPLAISGWNTLILRRALIDILTDPDSVTKHGIQQFKLFLGGQ